MAEYGAGLHKEVTLIFQGAWDPEVDNTEQSYAPRGRNNTAYHVGVAPARGRHRESKLTSVARSLTRAPNHIFSVRSRRERKRLMSISRHLIINHSAG
jgi:hypothetical protein